MPENDKPEKHGVECHLGRCHVCHQKNEAFINALREVFGLNPLMVDSAMRAGRKQNK